MGPEKIAKIEREKGYLYYIDKEGNVLRKSFDKRKIDLENMGPEKIIKIQREKGWLYYLDGEGNILRQEISNKPKNHQNKYYVYVIECQTPDHYYIGYTHDLENRIEEHKKGDGAKFTKIHSVKKVIYFEGISSLKKAKDREQELTLEYMRKFGQENVAGSIYSQI